MKHEPRPGVWGDDDLPCEIIRINDDGVKVYNLGALFIPLTGENHRLRRQFRFE